MRKPTARDIQDRRQDTGETFTEAKDALMKQYDAEQRLTLLTDTREIAIRESALEAASRAVQGRFEVDSMGSVGTFKAQTLSLAKAFEHYLRTGEVN